MMSIATLALKVLNNVARLDVELLQHTLMCQPALQQEFIHMMGYFLASGLPKLAQVDERPDPNDEPFAIEDLVAELVILTGYYALRNPENQETLRWGTGNSPNFIQHLTALPFRYFSDPQYRDILFPTLISICFADYRNTSIMENELNPVMLYTFIRQRFDSQTRAQGQVEHHETCALVAKNDKVEWMQFAHRFPVFLWPDALMFFDRTDSLDQARSLHEEPR